LCGFCAVAVWFFLEIWNGEQIKIELHSVVLVGFYGDWDKERACENSPRP
jgi:hypothetical protein